MANYLIKRDFYSFTTEIILNGITDSDDNVWINELPASIEVISSYLRFRYDTAKEFKPIITHDETDVYLESERVIDNDILYYALQDVPASTPITDGTYWKKGDSRNNALVQVLVVVVLYNIYSRLNGSEIPNWLQVMYDGGDPQQRGGKLGYLKDIRKGTVQIDLDLLPEVESGETQSGNSIAFGNAKDSLYKNTSI